MEPVLALSRRAPFQPALLAPVLGIVSCASLLLGSTGVQDHVNATVISAAVTENEKIWIAKPVDVDPCSVSLLL